MIPRLILAFLVTASASIAAEPTAPRAPRKPVVWNNPDKVKSDLVTHHELVSASMDRVVGYTLYLPPGYAEDGNTTRYPVVYFLHGAGGNESADGPAFAGYIHRQSAKYNFPPVICVFPNGGMSAYRNHPDTGINVETMIIDELLPHIDATYRTLPQRESRGLAGYSMGGGGAVHLALKHSDLFSVAASWAGSQVNFRTKELYDDITIDMLRAQEPTIRLLMITGYDDQATYDAHGPFTALLDAAKYPYTLRKLRGVNHNLGLYYVHTARDLVTFLLQDIATAVVE
ncbi:alpha/beta hydrolase [Synoicihabitans lomoniglobus]|uniref:Alpha/beta hydrolase-fold protein n=1 Tax=Synoicihabitans lomoniglobus TaxID=2909285 RepID=A0AAF0CLQ6_9BACT|nr:esterase family protein [Opitutaceae bacterium LMO-M01]WED63138.1 alpha/beta hydrolase-fold protein [Opitutaceae bacterium LMO-M01]